MSRACIMSSGGRSSSKRKSSSLSSSASSSSSSPARGSLDPLSPALSGSINIPSKKTKIDESQKNKGLRHFSLKVCNKVRAKSRTTYNEVADELLHELNAENPMKDKPFDEKNIRRRVYDALNVLVAMDIVAKEKKEV